MKKQTVVIRIKLAAIVLTAVFVLSYLPWQESGASAPQEPARGRIEIVGRDVPMSERTGADDGASFVVHFAGDTHGNLGPCG